MDRAIFKPCFDVQSQREVSCDKALIHVFKMAERDIEGSSVGVSNLSSPEVFIMQIATLLTK